MAGIWLQRGVLSLVLARAEGLPYRIAKSDWAGCAVQKSPWAVSDIPAVSGMCLHPPGGPEDPLQQLCWERPPCPKLAKVSCASCSPVCVHTGVEDAFLAGYQRQGNCFLFHQRQNSNLNPSIAKPKMGRHCTYTFPWPPDTKGLFHKIQRRESWGSRNGGALGGDGLCRGSRNQVRL